MLVADLVPGRLYALGRRGDLARRRTDLRRARLVEVRAYEREGEFGVFRKSEPGAGRYHLAEVYRPALRVWERRYLTSAEFVLPWETYEDLLDRWLGLPRTEIPPGVCLACRGSGVASRDAPPAAVELLVELGEKTAGAILVDRCRECDELEPATAFRIALDALFEGLASREKTITHAVLGTGEKEKRK